MWYHYSFTHSPGWLKDVVTIILFRWGIHLYKSWLKDLVTDSFRAKSGKRRYSYIVVDGLDAYFVKDHTNSKTKYTEDGIFNMINFLIDNIFVEFGGRICQQTVGIPMGTNCAPRLVDLFLYSYEVEFVQGLLRKGEKKLVQSFNYAFHYIDDVLSLNNKNFSKFLHIIYPVELVVTIQHILLSRLLTLTFTSNMTLTEPWQLNFMINVTILTFLSSTIPFSTVTSRHLLHMAVDSIFENL